MTDREIRVFRGGKLLKVITRAPRMGENGLEVTYKGEAYVLFNEDSIDTAGTLKASKQEPHQEPIVPSARPDESTGIDRRRDLPRSDDWNDAQRTVIEARPDAKMIVEAAPGTGKTAVACARIAYLLGEGIPADKIWMISFTRTAVQEIRNRVQSLAREEDEVSGVRISTLDSKAWQLRQGFDSTSDAMKAGFSEGIHATITLLRSTNSDLNDAVREFAHLVIDEAQDVVRERAEFVTELLRRLDRSCGVTILCDSAQAIYGFGDEESDRLVPDSDTLVTQLKENQQSGFTLHELSEVIRTNDPKLRSLFVDTRRLVLSAETSFAEVRASIEKSTHGTVSHALVNNGIAGRAEVLVLFRRRAEVLTNGSFFASGANPFRLRLSGFPVRLAPWLACVFGEWPQDKITRDKFMEQFKDKVRADMNVPVAEEAWMLLTRHAGVTTELIDLRTLREKLARPQPPIEFTMPEIGERGPLISTIHASKGREANEVHLMLAKDGREQSKEEQRVIFVGATRARHRLLFGKAVGGRSSQLRSGRRFSQKRNGTAVQVEVGRAGDLVESSVISNSEFESEESARRNQDWIRTLGGEPAICTAWRLPPGGTIDWRLQRKEGGEYVGALSPDVDRDIRQIRKWLGTGARLRLPQTVPNLFAVCARTVVRPKGHADLQGVHAPWAASGFWLVPVLFAYTTLYFNAFHRDTP
jgi:hypothetical protein